MKAVVLSVTEGDDKPLKYPAAFYKSKVMIINKTDLLPVLDSDVSLSFKGVIYPLVIAGHTFPAYAALYALAVNLAVTVIGTWVFNVLHIGAGQDGTLDAQPRGA